MNCTAILRVISRAGSSHVSPIGRFRRRIFLSRGISIGKNLLVSFWMASGGGSQYRVNSQFYWFSFLIAGRAMSSMPSTRKFPTFRPRARMLLLLGDQLIRDAGLAVFELVKNAYDADATSCTVTMHDITDPARASVTIEDDGVGMDLLTITDVWLEPGTDYRAKEREQKKRTTKFKRLPLGEKGVGRFAVHKLGQVIELVTRRRGEDEVVVRIDWADFENAEYLSEVPVSAKTRKPQVFTGSQTGTRIEVTQLREKGWTKRKVRDLHRAITSICSPFGAPDDFVASLLLEPESDWLDGLLDMKTVLQQSLFRVSGLIRGSELTYRLRIPPAGGVAGPTRGPQRQDKAMHAPLAIRRRSRRGA